MLERQDLDALLIGALYGELTPAETERLAQHLESHPADKVALDDMTRARKAVQDSRIFASMVEPPQAVSALLLQEAHRRRAPARARAATGSEDVSWFQRFLKSFVAHPAMAAATMLVLVVGVAGTLYLKNGQVGANETVSTRSNDIPPTINARAGGMELDQLQAQKQQQFKIDPNAVAGSGGYLAQLDEGGMGGKDKGAITPAPTAPIPPSANATGKADVGAQLAVSSTKPSGMNGVEVHHAGPTVKELPADTDLEQNVRLASDAPATPSPQHFASPAPVVAKTPAPAPPAAPQGAAGAVGGAPSPDNGPGAPGTSVATATPPPPPPAAAPRAEPRPPQQPPQQTDARHAEKKAENVQDNSGSTRDDSTTSLQAWAEGRHKALVALVQANNCAGAADVAMQIQGRAPDYYNQNVANDRAIKQCSPYITQRAQQQADEAQKRAAKAKAADDPAATKR